MTMREGRWRETGGPGRRVLLRLAILLAVSACGGGGALQDPTGFQTLEWTDLLPPDDLDALLSPPDWIDGIAEGSLEDSLELDLESLDPAARRYFEALRSSRVIVELEGRAVRVAGFVVPLELDAENRVVEFFLVPWFGACLHLPPPPPNQLILVRSDRGVPPGHPEEPVWVEGILGTEVTDHELGRAAYVLAATRVTPYLQEP